MNPDFAPGWQFFLQLMNTVHSLLEDVEPALAELNLEPKSFFLLNVLDENPYPAQLSKCLMLPSPTVTFLLKRLEKNGHIKRSTEPNDLRKFRFSITSAGRKAVSKGQQVLNDALQAKLSKLNESDQAKLFELLGKL